MEIFVIEGNGHLVHIPAPKRLIDPNGLFSENIYWMNDALKEYIFHASFHDEIPEADLHSILLKGPIRDVDIMRNETPLKISIASNPMLLWRLYYLTQKQKLGQFGDLITDGYANVIGYTIFAGEQASITANYRRDSGLWQCVLGPLNTWHKVKIFSA